MTIVRKEVNGKPVVTAEKLAMLAKLDNMSDSDINFDDIPEQLDWDNAVSGFVGTKGLDKDIAEWFEKQDSTTKAYVNNTLRNMMNFINEKQLTAQV